MYGLQGEQSESFWIKKLHRTASALLFFGVSFFAARENSSEQSKRPE